jgi:type IV secretory pathway VirD2 relaxase
MAPSVLYGPDGHLPRERFEEPRLNEQHQFRFMVSPEDGHELDLHDYVPRLMHLVERELGRSLEWAAANHYDSEHPHAHVVVRGVDLHGRRVLLSRQYISHGMRRGHRSFQSPSPRQSHSASCFPRRETVSPPVVSAGSEPSVHPISETSYVVSPFMNA